MILVDAIYNVASRVLDYLIEQLKIKKVRSALR
jgi:hypothetical protein